MLYLSAGHNLQARGAQALVNGSPVFEHDEALRWLDLIERELEPTLEHVRVPIGSLTDKVRYVNTAAKSRDLAVELHFNSDTSGRQRGSETLYHPRSVLGRRAAQIVQHRIGQAFPPDRGVKEGWYRMDRPGHEDYPGDVEGDEVVDYWLRATRCVALILEPEFLYNYATIDRLRELGCRAIARGLEHAVDTVQNLPK